MGERRRIKEGPGILRIERGQKKKEYEKRIRVYSDIIKL